MCQGRDADRLRLRRRRTPRQRHDRRDGRRRTFFFAPRGVFGSFATPDYLAEPGEYGSLRASGCGLLANSGGIHPSQSGL